MQSAAPHNRVPVFVPIATRVSAALAVLLATATAAFADPRLVRVIWDVGRGHVYYRTESRTAVGDDRFRVPNDAGAAEAAGFDETFAGAAPFLRKGDRVRVYVVNYNPVAHVWHESSVIEQVALEPSPGGALLNAAVLAITGAGKLPIAGLSPNWVATTPTRLKTDPCGDLDALRTALSGFATAALAVDNTVASTLGRSEPKQLVIDAKTLADVPRSARQWNEFDNATAWTAIREDIKGDFDQKYEALAGEIKKAGTAIEASSAKQLELDREVAKINIGALSEICLEAAKAVVARRDNLLALLEEVVGAGSPFAALRARFDTAGTQWSGYKRKIATTNWTAEAIEVPLKDPIQTDAVLRVDAVFVSPDKTSTERQYRSLALAVAPHWPTLLIGSGVAFNNFAFKKLQVVKVTTTAADGAISAKSQFEIVPDTTIERIVPVWLQSLRVWVPHEQVGLYATFGTTPDRNIFRNAIVGGSAHIRRWKTTITYGAIMFRGYEAGELEPVVTLYSDASGFALADVTAANVQLPRLRRHYSRYLAISFTLVSF